MTALPVQVVRDREPLRLVGGLQLTAAASEAAAVDPATLIRRWLEGKAPSTRRTYGSALQRFGVWAIGGSATPEQTMQLLCEAGVGKATAMAEAWRDSMLTAGLSPGSVACFTTALCSLVRCCRRAGLVTWGLEGIAPKAERRCDRSGPRRHEVARLVEHVDAEAAAGDRQAVRDAALIRLLFCAGLRRMEAVNLRLVDVDLDAGTVKPRRKGRRERAPVSVSVGCAQALRRWLAIRGTEGEWLFVRTDRAAEGDPLNGSSVWRLLRSWAAAAGLRCVVRPHGLRHSGATEVAARGSLASLMAYGGWSSMTSASRYLDKRAEERAAALEVTDL